MPACPNCREPMQVQHYQRKQGGELELDFCFACQLIWFDQYESAQLAPSAVVALFEQLHVHRAEVQPGRPLNERLGCVQCGDTLLLTHDMVRSNRFVYHRCGGGHGRLIGFWHFLREKQFVRDLTTPERQQLAAAVAQVKCTSCGAGVDVRQHSACHYCRAPLAVLDRDAVAKALHEYRAGASLASAEATADALLARERAQAELERGRQRQTVNSADQLMDLLFDGISDFLGMRR